MRNSMSEKLYSASDLKIVQFDKITKNKITGEVVHNYNRVIFVKSSDDIFVAPIYSPLSSVDTVQNYQNSKNKSFQDALLAVTGSRDTDMKYIINNTEIPTNASVRLKRVSGRDGVNFANDDAVRFNSLYFYPGNSSTRPMNLPKINVCEGFPENIKAEEIMMGIVRKESCSLDDLKFLQASFMFFDNKFNEFVNTHKLNFNSDMSPSAGPNN